MVRKGIIDFTAFLSKNDEVIIKELTVIDIYTKATQHWIFQPPKDQLVQLDCYSSSSDYHNNWMRTHYHGLYYSNGTTSYESLTSALENTCRDIHLLFAPTTEKAKVLEEIFRHERAVISLQSLGCPQLPRDMLYMTKEDEKKKSSSCLFHEIYAPGFYCTQNAVQTMAEWCDANIDKLDMNKSENRVKTFENWQLSSPTVQQLADQGFIQTSRKEDSTKCVYCGIVLHQWLSDDKPFEDHKFNSPFCRFVNYHEQEENEKKKKKDNSKGEDVCGCYEMIKITEKELHNLCFA